jgi:hypothetical protein
MAESGLLAAFRLNIVSVTDTRTTLRRIPLKINSAQAGFSGAENSFNCE